ncbi:flagellar biosynthesis anti-sigma factor FlgM [Citrobacter amalonaticus]|nr:flagellar biosynthesis anti-sigma factor FlgM [Citrobacter amalonaticus]
MSIERTLPVTPGSTQHDVTLRTKTRETNAEPAEKVCDAGSNFKLSALTQQIQNDSGNDVNVERLASIKAAMDAGELQIDTDKIAHALLQDLF